MAENDQDRDPEPREFTQRFTEYLLLWQDGDEDAYDKLFTLVYQDLRQRAHLQRMKQGRGSRYRTTELAHEAVIKLVMSDEKKIVDKEHFLNIASKAMLQILIDYGRRGIRRQDAQGRRGQVEIDKVADRSNEPEKLIDLKKALEKLEIVNKRWAAIAVLKLHYDKSAQEIAEIIGISKNTVNNIWPQCRKFLAGELKDLVM